MVLFELNCCRLCNFCCNKWVFWLLVIFLLLFVVLLFVELIVNDWFIVVNYKGGWYFLVYKFYLEIDFGGDFGIEVIYIDSGV